MCLITINSAQEHWEDAEKWLKKAALGNFYVIALAESNVS